MTADARARTRRAPVALACAVALAVLAGAACSLGGPESADEPAAQARPALATSTPAASPMPTPRATSFPPSPAQALTISPHVQPPDRDLHELAARLRPGVGGELARTATITPPSRQVGHTDSFWISDEVDDEPISYTIEASIAVVTEHAYWYVDLNADISTVALSRAAAEFEERVHPLLTDATGDVWNPGVDNDPRFTVLHTPLVSAAGYFGSRDEYTKATHPRSNEREMIYMNSDIEPGTEVYMGVLTHEFQHAVSWNQDGGEESWINEGLAEYATHQAGYAESFVDRFLVSPGTQLNFWPDSGRATVPHYGAAELFVNYLADHYGGYDGVGRMYRLSEDGEKGVDTYMAQFGLRFEDVFRDWVVANYLDADEGIYGYASRDVHTLRVSTIAGFGDREGTLAQFSSRYFELRLGDGGARIRFEGQPTVRQTAADCRSGSRCWWSNRGDSVDSTLTREFDLSGLEAATLEFWAWFDIEEGWDYAYVQASDDGGRTWNGLEGAHSTTTDPVGNSYGPGYTGSSGGWVSEELDLTPYAGGKVLVRFEYVTDDAVYLDGLLIDDLGIPELGYRDDAEREGAWDARGFALIDNTLPQSYIVQIVEIPALGPATVRQLPLDSDWIGEAVVNGFGSRIERAVIVVSPSTRHTHQRASYRLAVEPAP